MLRVRTSRRVAGMKPTDFDHNIEIVDHDEIENNGTASPGETTIERVTTDSRLLPTENGSQTPSPRLGNDTESPRMQERPVNELDAEQELPQAAMRPSIEIRAPTPDAFHGEDPQVVPKKPKIKRETAIDILYENERGGFLCGRPLFSAAALGGLDPSAWTNAYHKPSPTSIHTAQVPDPSWEWVWSDWHVNEQDGTDSGGWEYAFAFSKAFSWHKARWYNSFVRRRAWTRKRAKKDEADISVDPYTNIGDYFTVRPASDRESRRSQQSLASSRAPSRTSLAYTSSIEPQQAKPDIDDLETLLRTLRLARIDREKLEATENYLENAMDLPDLQEKMHDVMALFVFQASRRLLLSHLMILYDETTKQLEAKDDPDLKERQSALKAALKHADEEVRKLAYWSDVKQMAETGKSTTAVDEDKGWSEGWEGLDKSGPVQPNRGKLPA